MKLLDNALLISLIAAAGAAIYVYVSDAQTAQAQDPPSSTAAAAPVRVAQAELATLIDTVEAVGDLRANEAAAISPEIAGRIASIEFQEGEPVEAGAPLLRLDDEIYQAEVAQAQASLELSRNNYERAEELLARGAGSVTARDEALAQQSVDEAELALAQARLAKMTIRAPFDGMIGLRSVSVGDYVTPGQVIVTLVDTDPIKVDFRIPEIYLAELHKGQAIEMSVDALPGESFEGEVYAIDPVIDINGRAIELRALIPNPDGRLQPGLFARVDVNVDTREDAVLVDESALIAREHGQFVYQVQDGRARLTRVRVGLRRPGQVEITDGLAPDAVVVTAGHERLEDGMPVDIAERS
jgi:membrane fusion protein, multidrug efflux system